MQRTARPDCSSLTAEACARTPVDLDVDNTCMRQGIKRRLVVLHCLLLLSPWWCLFQYRIPRCCAIPARQAWTASQT